MASPNVDKVLLALQDNRVIAVEIALAFAKLEAAAGVSLTREEKTELFRELADLTSRELFIFAPVYVDNK